MAEVEIIIPAEILRLIDERRQLVQEVATSQSKIAELERLARQVPISASNQALAPLTQENTPISELNAVLQKLPTVLVRMQQLEARLQQPSVIPHTQVNAPLASPATSVESEYVPVPSFFLHMGRATVRLWLSGGIVLLFFIIFLLLLVHR